MVDGEVFGGVSRQAGYCCNMVFRNAILLHVIKASDFLLICGIVGNVGAPTKLNLSIGYEPGRAQGAPPFNS